MHPPPNQIKLETSWDSIKEVLVADVMEELDKRQGPAAKVDMDNLAADVLVKVRLELNSLLESSMREMQAESAELRESILQEIIGTLDQRIGGKQDFDGPPFARGGPKVLIHTMARYVQPLKKMHGVQLTLLTNKQIWIFLPGRHAVPVTAGHVLL